MRRRISSPILLLLLLLTMSVNVSAFSEEYHLGTGDVINISVWGFDDLQVKDVVIGPTGNIVLPVVGDIAAAGCSPASLANDIALHLKKYIRDPIVSVIVSKYRTTRIYVFGEVNKPGMYEIDKQCNILDAIGIAGSYTDKAAKKNIFVIRKHEQKPLRANLLNLLNKGDMTQNYALIDGDVVYLTSNNKVDIQSILSGTVAFTRGNTSYQVGNSNK